MFGGAAYCVASVAMLAQAASSSDTIVAHSSSSPRHLGEIGRRLTNLAARDQREFSNSTSLDKSFDNAVLFKIETEAKSEDESSETTATAGIEVTCNTCYLKGQATARLKLDESFNITDTLHSIEDNVSGVIDNITDWVEDIKIDWSEAELDIPPPPDIDFNVNVQDMPEAVLEFQFDNTELYVDLSTTFSAGLTYSLKLFMQSLGVDLDPDLFLGFVFSIDLILSLENELTINHGFHIKLDDDVLLRIALFSKEATDMKFNGGQFEFLPVEVEAGGTVIRAVLQLSLRAGFALEADLIPGPDVELGPFNTEDFKAAAGLETRVYANIAELKTNITFGDDDDCDLRVQQAFQLAVGAAAGAYVGIGNRTWGPMPETEVPMFPTTFAGECVTKTKIEPKTTGIVEPRAPEDDSDLTTTTLTREATYTAVQCGETGAINCPANKETYREYAATETLMTSVASGSDATWPATITGAVNTKDFGKGAVAITSSSGKPKPDDPKTADDDDGFFDQETGGVSNKVIIGVSVGLGVPFIIALIAGIILWRRKASKKAKPYDDTAYTTVSAWAGAK